MKRTRTANEIAQEHCAAAMVQVTRGVAKLQREALKHVRFFSDPGELLNALKNAEASISLAADTVVESATHHQQGVKELKMKAFERAEKAREDAASGIVTPVIGRGRRRAIVAAPVPRQEP
jgi:hypothetical protein